MAAPGELDEHAKRDAGLSQVELFPDRLGATRLELRRYHASDARGLLQLVDRNRDRLIRDFPELTNRLEDAGEASAYIEASDTHWNARIAFIYGIWLPSEARPIGQLSVKNIVWNCPSAELSYFVDRDWLRKGIAMEAICAVRREAFELRGFRRIYVRVIAANEESLALSRRLKLRHEGIHRNAFRCGFGELHDVHLFAMTDGDYDSDPREPSEPPSRRD